MMTFEIKTKIVKIGGVNFLSVDINKTEYTLPISNHLNTWDELIHYDKNNTIFDLNRSYDKNNKLNVTIVNKDDGSGYKFYNVGEYYGLPITIGVVEEI